MKFTTLLATILFGSLLINGGLAFAQEDESDLSQRYPHTVPVTEDETDVSPTPTPAVRSRKGTPARSARKPTPTPTPDAEAKPVTKLPPKKTRVPSEPRTEETAPPADTRPERPAEESVVTAPETSGEMGARPFARVAGQLTFLSLPAPFKFGLSAAWLASSRLEIEAQFLKGSLSIPVPYIDLGGLDETQVILNGRVYPLGGSFNVSAGLAWQRYEANLGSSIVSRYTSYQSEFDLIKIDTLGLQLGFGNRWVFGERFTIGTDWLVLNFPFLVLKDEVPGLDFITNQGDRDRVEDATRFMRYLPTGTIAKVYLGYSF